MYSVCLTGQGVTGHGLVLGAPLWNLGTFSWTFVAWSWNTIKRLRNSFVSRLKIEHQPHGILCHRTALKRIVAHLESVAGPDDAPDHGVADITLVVRV